MDYENMWPNCTDESSQVRKNNQQNAPLYFSEPSYVPGSGMHSFINARYCSSPGYSNFINYPPDAYTANDMNGSAMCRPYYPHFASLNYRNAKDRKICHQFYDGAGCSSEMEQKGYYSQMNYQQSMKMNPPPLMMNSDIRSNLLKPNLKRKRKLIQGKNKNTLPTCTSLIPNAKNIQNSQVNLANQVPNNQLLTENNEANEEQSVTNEQNFVNKKPCFSQVVNEPLNFQIENFNQPSDLSKAACAITDSILNDENVPNQARNNFHSINNELITENTLINMVGMNNLIQNDSSALSGSQVAEISTEVSDSTNSQIINEKIEHAGNTDSYILQPIFEGKDENGKDIIVLLAAPEIQEVAQENSIDTVVDTENIKIGKNPEVPNDLSENKLISNETVLTFSTEEPLTNQEVLRDQNDNTSIFYSSIDNYALEEIVKTSRNKCSNIRSKNKQNPNMNAKETASLKKSEKHWENNFIDEESDSGTDNSWKTIISYPRYKRTNENSQSHTQKWKTRFKWKSSKTLNDLQYTYFSKFLKTLQIENKHIMNHALWNTMKIILNNIGGSVLQSIYNTFQEMIEISSQKKKCTSQTSKRNKKPLQVKLMCKTKKKDNLP